jgi:hypothetical protein
MLLPTRDSAQLWMVSLCVSLHGRARSLHTARLTDWIEQPLV